ncbi:hypothetical protein N0V88_004593 [Collariella sp. IMI 366227]|nr:hypothetical protein N0V88_004593 [Collariella sp. IMI 366227]
MTPPPPLFHALLRPAVLQILRATGYHSAKTSVLDAATDLAARYFFRLCQLTALYATHNSNINNDSFPEDPLSSIPGGFIPAAGSSNSPGAAAAAAVPAPTIVDVRMALQQVGALLPERLPEEQEFLGGEDMRGVEAFLAWAMGPLNREVKRIALDGVDEAGDYLDALKKKHSKNDDDSKYLGTLLGKSIEHGDVLVEGGECPSIFVWEERRKIAGQKTPEPPLWRVNGHGAEGEEDGDGDNDGEGSRPGSSGLSSLGDRSIADEMDIS